MNIMFLAIVIIIVVGIFLVITVMKKLMKVALLFAGLFILLFLITGGSIISDFSKLKDNLNKSSSIVLLEDRDNIITGFIDSEQYDLLDSKEIAFVNGLYNDNKLSEILSTHYKLFIIKSGIISELDVDVNNKEVTSEQIYDYLISNMDIKQITPEDVYLGIDVVEESNEKAAFFAYLYDKEIRITKSPIFFFRNYKDKEIIVYPETMFFKFTKIIPLVWIDEKLNKLKEQIIEKKRG